MLISLFYECLFVSLNAINALCLPGLLIVSTSISEMGIVRSGQVASTRYFYAFRAETLIKSCVEVKYYALLFFTDRQSFLSRGCI